MKSSARRARAIAAGAAASRHLGRARDLRHRPDGLDRPARRSPSRPESMTASAPSWTARATSETSARVGDGVLDHGLEHLRRDDDGHGVPPPRREDLALGRRDAREADLDAEVAARDHERVGRRRDAVEVAASASGRSIFATIQGRRSAGDRLEEPPELRDVRRAPHEREPHEVDPRREPLGEVAPVLRRQRRSRQRRSSGSSRPRRSSRGRPPSRRSRSAPREPLDDLAAGPPVVDPDLRARPDVRRGARDTSRRGARGPTARRGPRRPGRSRPCVPSASEAEPPGSAPTRIFGPPRSRRTPTGTPAARRDPPDERRPAGDVARASQCAPFRRTTSTPASRSAVERPRLLRVRPRSSRRCFVARPRGLVSRAIRPPSRRMMPA